jgi:hypothetical protein
VLALGGAVPFVAGRLSYQSLFRFAILLVVYLTLGGFIVASVAAGTIADPIPESPADRAIVVAVAYPLAAYVLANAGEWKPLEETDVETEDGEESDSAP